MRILSALCALSLLLGGASFAQETELPTDPQASPAQPIIPPDVLSPSERAASTPLPAPSLPTIPELDNSFKKNPATPALESARLRIEWRKLRNQTKDDSKLKAALQAADRARTDLERRNLLRSYYEVFYARMTALTTDPSIINFLADRKREHLAGLAQPRVRPTPTPSPTPKPKPIPPPPLPEASPTPSASTPPS